ncbi:uncharacterized protein LOC111716853 [Eurytemora carolleeae]|uniref:uncharacterized protein LOC111716853 n=1 Tax=Eurytemora carolleeae TaxID=1294199 RepID=UPI000C759B1E|nr:uncharacterized protein LOC111716853 [Eurytemora carolleeae]|eukprot:XP_023348127.1 uncharacterized protein LOC111716853 [Eurytemora affinis]
MFLTSHIYIGRSEQAFIQNKSSLLTAYTPHSKHEMRGLIIVCLSALLASCYAKKESRIEYVGRLQRDLFKDYDSEIIPLVDSLDGKTGLNVSVGLNMVYMDMTGEGIKLIKI